MEKGRKNATVLDAAIEDVHRCLQNRTFDSFPVTPVAKKSSLRHPYNDESKVKELTNASLIYNAPVLSALVEEHQFLAKHSVQHTFSLEFIKCTDQHCNHCTGNPVQVKKLLTFLREFGEGHIFTPTPSTENADH